MQIITAVCKDNDGGWSWAAQQYHSGDEVGVRKPGKHMRLCQKPLSLGKVNINILHI